MRRFAALPWGTKLGILRVGAWLWAAGGLADRGCAGGAGLGWRAACRHRLPVVRSRPCFRLVLEPCVGYPPLLLRARVSVSCTDLGLRRRPVFSLLFRVSRCRRRAGYESDV